MSAVEHLRAIVTADEEVREKMGHRYSQEPELFRLRKEIKRARKFLEEEKKGWRLMGFVKRRLPDA